MSLAIIWNCKPVCVKYSVYYPSEKHIYSSYPSKVFIEMLGKEERGLS